MKDFADLSLNEATAADIPIAAVVKSLSEEQEAALCRGEPVITAHGTLFPMVTRLPGADEPMVTAVLSHMTQDVMDGWRAKHERFAGNLGELLKATASAGPEAVPAVRELLESYREYDDATNNVVETVLADYANMLASFSALPSITIRAERGSAANKRHRNSPAGKAKAAAEELWPEANRKGWSAVRLHTELVGMGHTISPGRVAKWLTNLRRTGRC